MSEPKDLLKDPQLLKNLAEVCENPKVLEALNAQGLTIDFKAISKMVQDANNVSIPMFSFTTLEQDIDNLNVQMDAVRLTMIAVLKRIAREKAGYNFPFTSPAIPYMPVLPPLVPAVPNYNPQWEYHPNTPQIICSGGTTEKMPTAVCVNSVNQADGCSDPGDVHGA